MHIKSDGQDERGVAEARAEGLKVIERWGKMDRRKGGVDHRGEGDRKWLYLGYLQGDSVWQNIPKGLLLQRGIDGGEGENFKVQKLFADVQMCSKSLWGPEGAQMLFDWICLPAQRLQND